MKIDWTVEDSNAALYGEGWDIFLTDYDSPEEQESEKFQVQAWCDFEHETGRQTTFFNDADAWRHVYRKAAEGSALHQKALAFLRQEKVLEYERILSAAAFNGW